MGADAAASSCSHYSRHTKIYFSASCAIKYKGHKLQEYFIVNNFLLVSLWYVGMFHEEGIVFPHFIILSHDSLLIVSFQLENISLSR